MLVLARKIHDLRYFSFRHLVSEHPTLADTVMVDMQHDARCGLAVLLKEPLEHVNDELHGRVVVVEQQTAIKPRSLRLRLGFGDDGRPRAVLALRFRSPPAIRGVHRSRGRSTGGWSQGFMASMFTTYERTHAPRDYASMILGHLGRNHAAKPCRFAVK